MFLFISLHTPCALVILVSVWFASVLNVIVITYKIGIIYIINITVNGVESKLMLPAREWHVRWLKASILHAFSTLIDAQAP